MESVSYALDKSSFQKSLVLWLSLFFVAISSAILFYHASTAYGSDSYIHKSGTISVNTTWGPTQGYVLDSTVTVNSGVLLSILDGVAIKFKTATSDLIVNGQLNVQGIATATGTVVFTSYRDDYATGTQDDTNGDGASTTPAASNWRNIQFNSGSSSTIKNANIRYGGFATGGSSANVYNANGVVVLSNVEVATSSLYGFFAAGGTSTIDSSNFHHLSDAIYQTGGYLSISSSTSHDNTHLGIYVNGGRAQLASSTLVKNDSATGGAGRVTYSTATTTTFVHWGNTATGGGTLAFIMDGTLSNDETWTKDNVSNDIPYEVDGFTIAAGKTLTINPGVVVKFNRFATPQPFTVNGTLNALGTTSSLITFTSFKDDSILGDSNGDGTSTGAAGNWQHIKTTSGGTTNISNAIVRFGGHTGNSGDSGANIYNTSGTLTIANTLIATSSNYGVYMTSGTTNITSSTIRNTTTYGIYVTSGTLTVSYSDIHHQKEGIHMTGGTVSGGSNSIHDNTNYGAYKSAAPTSTLLYNYWGDSSGPHHTSTNASGTGNAVSDYVAYNPWLSQAPPPQTFYGQIKNTVNGRWLLEPTPAYNSDFYSKRLPQDWVVYVSSTASPTGTPRIAGGYRWYEVVDKQDASNTLAGWMQGEDTSTSPTYYLPYVNSLQSDFQATSRNLINASTSRATIIDNAVNLFYKYPSSSASLSLYSSEVGTNHLWKLHDRAFERRIILAIAAQESGIAGFDFNNELISYDYGHGIMQLTPLGVWDHEPTSSGSYASNTENLAANGSYLDIPSCYMQATTTYTKCYTYAGTHNSTATKQYMAYTDNPSVTYKYYTNVQQSIYANVKDGMRTLETKLEDFIPSPITSSSPAVGSPPTVYSGLEREAVLLTEYYNGDNCGYVATTSIRLSNIVSFFSNETSSDLTGLTDKMKMAGDQTLCASLKSPGNLTIEDSRGRTIGVVNGKATNDFLWGLNDTKDKWVKILFPDMNENYTYKVVGTGTGTYGLNITIKDGSEQTVVKASRIPIVPREVYTFTVDRNALRNNQKGVTVKIDNEGDGIIDKTITTDGTLSDIALSDNPDSLTLPELPKSTPPSDTSTEIPQSSQMSWWKKLARIVLPNFVKHLLTRS